MYFEVKLLIWNWKSVLKCVKKHCHESVLSLSTLKWSFISFILYYVQVQLFLHSYDLKYTTRAHSVKFSTLLFHKVTLDQHVLWKHQPWFHSIIHAFQKKFMHELRIAFLQSSPHKTSLSFAFGKVEILNTFPVRSYEICPKAWHW